MIGRDLYIAAYDIRDRRRLPICRNVLKNYATGGQKSVFECFLSSREKRQLLAEVRRVMEVKEDRFVLLKLGTCPEVRILGIAVKPADQNCFYVG